MIVAPLKIDARFRFSLLCIVFAGLTFMARHNRLDDALIYARYISHAYHGRGLVYNDGERVNALTSVLDTWLQLGLTCLLRGRVLLAQSILGSSFLLASLVLAEMTVPFAGLLLAASSYFYIITGMETSLFIFCLALTVHAYVKGRMKWLPLLCALCFLSRFEGGAMTVVVAWQCWKQRRWPSLASFLPAILLIALYLLLNMHFYGAPLPQSATAKLGQGASGYWGRWPTAFLHFQGGLYTYEGGTGVYLLMLLAWLGSRDLRMSAMNRVALPLVLVLGAFYILFNIPNYHWYYAPFIYFFTLYAARLISDSASVQRAVLALVLCMAFSSCFFLHVHAIEAQDYADAGDWLNRNTPRDAKIASVETGTVGWHCDRYLIDIVGLTTPINATYTAHADYTSWFAERPDFIIVHPDGHFPWDKIALQSPEYTLLPVHFDEVRILERKAYAKSHSQ